MTGLERIFDTDLIIERRRRAHEKADQDATFLMDRAVDDLLERLSTIERRFENAATVFCTTPAAAEALLSSGKVKNVLRVEAHAAFLDGGAGKITAGDRLPLEAESVDLVVSLLALQETNDIPGALIQIRRALRPDGLSLGAMAGAG